MHLCKSAESAKAYLREMDALGQNKETKEIHRIEQKLLQKVRHTK